MYVYVAVCVYIYICMYLKSKKITPRKKFMKALRKQCSGCRLQGPSPNTGMKTSLCSQRSPKSCQVSPGVGLEGSKVREAERTHPGSPQNRLGVLAWLLQGQAALPGGQSLPP